MKNIEIEIQAIIKNPKEDEKKIMKPLLKNQRLLKKYLERLD